MPSTLNAPSHIGPAARDRRTHDAVVSTWRRPRAARVPTARSTNVVRVEFLVTVPALKTDETPPCIDQGIYISGNHARLGDWRADGLLLTPIGRGEYQGQIEIPRGYALEYKITRGSWASVEQSATGEPMSNRRLTANSSALELITVDRWMDDGQFRRPAPRRERGRVRLLTGLTSKNLTTGPRTVAVYLPAEYDAHPGRRYPVLYMQDGQNLFGAAADDDGRDWKAAETADRLIVQRRVEPFIIVGIENSPSRLDEYGPVYDKVHGAGGQADAYARFIAHELKPLIDRQFRTRPQREHTFIGGSSMGAIASMHACLRHPDVFGGCAALSPSLWWADHSMSQHFRSDIRWLQSLRLWIDMGTAEGCADGEADGHAAEVARQFADSMIRIGSDRALTVHFEVIDDGGHHERDWAARFDRVLEFLLGGARNGTAM